MPLHINAFCGGRFFAVPLNLYYFTESEFLAMPKTPSKTEILTHGTHVHVSKTHKFGADALILANFCGAKRMQNVCDLGTGCGIIPLRLFDRGHRGLCVAIDIANAAIDLLNVSVQQNNADNIKPICADIKDILPKKYLTDNLQASDTFQQSNNANSYITKQPYISNTNFDVITCNPPYFTSGFVSPVAERASARHEQSLNMFYVCKAAAFLLKDGGKLCICQRPERLADVICEMKASNIEPKRLQFVCTSHKKKPWLILIEGQKNRASGLVVLPPLITENADGTRPSPQMREIYEN